MYFITTDRLRIRPYTLADAPFSLRLVNSRPWLDFIGDRKINDLTAAEAYIQDRILQLYRKFGFGMYLVEDRYSGQPLGSCGLGKREELPYPEIGFAFLPEAIGQGYGYESAQAVVAYARDQLDLEALQAVVLPTNLASVGLLRKLGMSRQGTLIIEAEEGESTTLDLYGMPLRAG
jgi:RimJ/RimL family protein N-acetyltransferase